MRHITFILALFAGALCVTAQIRITGRVLNKEGHPAEGFVTLGLAGQSTMLSYANLDEKGRYTLTFNGQADSLCIRVSGITIAPTTKVVPCRTQTLDFTVESQDFELQEVDIKVDPVTVRGDTTDYLVSSYTEQGDRVIGDVLKKIPGIDVSQSGAISYNGKPISKFYVEEMDMLQGRYGLAVNNISADDVSKVQVMEHHQPIKMLQNRTYSDNVAINLKLKDKAKGTYALSTALGAGLQQRQGGGVTGLWNEELIGMYFGKDRQTMQTYKGNNSADNILAELSNQYGGSHPIPISRVNVLRPGTPGLPQKRYMDNRTHALSANWLERITKEKELTFNAVYTYDEQQRAGDTYTEHYRPLEAGVGIHETQTSRDKSHNLELAHKYTNNADRNYNSNALSARIAWSDANAYGLTTSQTYNSIVSQDMRSVPFSIQDAAEVQCLLGENIFRFNLRAGYAQSTQTLRVTEYDTRLRIQELLPRNLSLSAFTSYEKRWKYISGEYGFSASAALYGEDGTLSGETNLSPEDCRNNLWYGSHRLSVFQTYRYRYSHGIVTLGLPVALDVQHSNDRVRRERQAFFHPVVMPSLSANYDWNIYHSLHAKAEYDQQVGALNNVFRGYVMENYRTIIRSQIEKLFSRRSARVSGGYRYSNALQQVHFNANVSYGFTWRNQIESVVYNDIYSTSVVEDLSNTSSSFSASTGMDKHFSWCRSSIKWNIGYQHSEYQRFINTRMMDYRQHSGSASLSGFLTPVSWMTVAASLGGSLSKTRNELTTSATMKDYMGRLSLRFCPTKLLTLTVSGEGTYDNWANKDNWRYFCDLRLQYAFRRATLELEGNNLLNQKKYVLNRTDNMDIYHLEYALRPRNVLIKVRFKIL